MKQFIILGITLTLAGCSGGEEPTPPPCPEYYLLNRCVEDGQDGEQGPKGDKGDLGDTGENGADGSNGFNAVVSIVNSAPSCSNGGITVLSATDSNNSGSLDSSDSNIMSAEVCNGNNGADGEDGQDGQDGEDGQDGIDGEDGEDGADAPPTAFSPVDVIDPCGDHPTKVDEVLVKLSNGKILASFSDNANGLNTRFAFLNNGTYGTTDGTGCVFTVNNGNVTW